MKRANRTPMKSQLPDLIVFAQMVLARAIARAAHLIVAIALGFGLLSTPKLSPALAQDPVAAPSRLVQGSVTSYYLIIDTSASMKDVPQPPLVPVAWQSTKLDEVKRQLAELCGNLPTESSVRVVLFDEGPPRIGPGFDLLGDRERASLREFFSSLLAEGQRTYAWRTLDHVLTLAGNDLITSSRTAGIRILMFTDGLDNDPSRPNLEAVLARHRDLLQDKNGPVQLNYLTLGFTLSSEMRNLFVSYGVEAVSSLRPEDVIPLMPNFSWSPQQPVEKDEVQFIDQSTGPIVACSWNFGGGREITHKSPRFRFSKPGQHQVRLTIRGSGGRSQSIERIVVVSPAPPLLPQFEVFPSEVKLGDAVLFRNLTAAPAVTYAWNFGDGNQTTDREPTHTYTRSGAFSVILTARSKDGEGKSLTVTNAVRVVGPPPPRADFVAPEQVTVHESFAPIDRSSGEISQRVWNFGDGTPLLEGKDAKHRYLKPGVYTIKLTCEGIGGTNDFSKTIRALPAPAPQIQVIPSEVRLGIDVLFRNSTATPGMIFLWSFGDGTQSTNQEPTHAYARPGTYSVALIVRDRHGQEDTVTVTNAVRVIPPPPPVASFVVPKKVMVSESIEVVDRSTGEINDRRWDFGDGTQLGQSKEMKHCYSQPGKYTVTLSCLGPGGTNVASQTIEVMALPAPVAAFVVGSERPLVGERVRFVNRSTGQIDRIEWWFAGNQKPVRIEGAARLDRSAPPVTHEFKTAGDHIVRLIVVGPGGRDECHERVRVMLPPPPAAPPQAKFEVDQQKGKAPLIVRFRNRSEGTVLGVTLDFGDGSPHLATTNFSECLHTYLRPGNYQPTLRARGVEQFLPSIYSLPNRVITVQGPPSWFARNWWRLGLGLCGLIMASVFVLKVIASRRWVASRQQLRGTLSVKRVERVGDPWQQFPITGSNGEFEIRLPIEVVVPAGTISNGNDYLLRLKKRLDVRQRREHFSAEILNGGDLLEVVPVEPGSEQSLTKPSIIIRYDN